MSEIFVRLPVSISRELGYLKTDAALLPLSARAKKGETITIDEKQKALNEAVLVMEDFTRGVTLETAQSYLDDWRTNPRSHLYCKEQERWEQVEHFLVTAIAKARV